MVKVKVITTRRRLLSLLATVYIYFIFTGRQFTTNLSVVAIYQMLGNLTRIEKRHAFSSGQTFDFKRYRAIPLQRPDTQTY